MRQFTVSSDIVFFRIDVLMTIITQYVRDSNDKRK